MQCRTLTNEWHCNNILCFFFCMQGSAVGRQSGCAVQCTNYKTPQLEVCKQPAIFRGWFYISCIQCMCFLISVSEVFWKKCGCQWHLFASVQWVNSLWRRNSSSASVYVLVPPVSWSRDEHEIYTRTCQDMIHAANTLTFIMANDDKSINKEKASDSLEWHVMQSPKKNTGFVLLARRVMKVCGLRIVWFAV